MTGFWRWPTRFENIDRLIFTCTNILRCKVELNPNFEYYANFTYNKNYCDDNIVS